MQKLELGKLLSGLSKITEYIRIVSRANTLQLVGDESLRQAKAYRPDPDPDLTTFEYIR